MNRSTDPWLISVTAMLIVLGLVMVYSASAVVAAEITGDETRYFVRQCIAVVLGLVVGGLSAFTPTRVMRRYRWVFFVAVCIGLAFIYVPGI
jgi:cell division protein FtsW